YLLALAPPARQLRSKLILVLTVLLAAGWVAFVSRQTRTYQAEAQGFDEILMRMEPHQRALSLVFLPVSRVAIAPTYLHYPAWYGAVGSGVVDPSFAGTHVELVVYRPEHLPLA